MWLLKKGKIGNFFPFLNRKSRYYFYDIFIVCGKIIVLAFFGTSFVNLAHEYTTLQTSMQAFPYFIHVFLDLAIGKKPFPTNKQWLNDLKKSQYFMHARNTNVIYLKTCFIELFYQTNLFLHPYIPQT